MAYTKQMDKTPLQRNTKYCDEIVNRLSVLGHATNTELLDYLRLSFPNLSATTIHRATSRLAQRGIINLAPSSKNGSIQYDTNVLEHDHFQCLNCNLLKDADIIAKVLPIIESSVDDCSISGRLTISGICKKCKNNKEKIQ